MFNEESKIIHTRKSYCRQGKKHPLEGEVGEDLAEETGFELRSTSEVQTSIRRWEHEEQNGGVTGPSSRSKPVAELGLQLRHTATTQGLYGRFHFKCS